MTRHVVVRADGDSRIGLGHILRSMAVSDELARTGTRISYLCKYVSRWAAAQLQKRGYQIEELDLTDASGQTEDADATVDFIERAGIDAVLLDSYALTTDWTRQVKSRTGCFIAAFDDLASDKRDVDILIDGSPGRRAADYSELIPSQALCLAGPSYAPLRPEFLVAREQKHAEQNRIHRVAISMGGVDPNGATLTCLNALDGRSDIDLTVILSSDARMLHETRARVNQMTTPTQLLLDRTDMAAVLRDMDLVIGAGGTSALERCALALPSVLVVLAENQVFNARQLAEAGAAVVTPKLSEKAVLEAVQPLLANPNQLEEMGRNAAKLCDGLGAPRVALNILARKSGVSLRPAKMDDLQIVHAWQSEAGARRFARNPMVPTFAEHQAWFQTRLTRSNQDPFYIITSNGGACGFVRLDRTEVPGTSEVSVLVSVDAQGRGVGRTALGLLRLTHPRRQIVAEVHPENQPSQRLFEFAGYTRSAVNRFVSEGWSEIVERDRDEN